MSQLYLIVLEIPCPVDHNALPQYDSTAETVGSPLWSSGSVIASHPEGPEKRREFGNRYTSVKIPSGVFLNIEMQEVQPDPSTTRLHCN